MFVYFILALIVPGAYLLFRKNEKRDDIILYITLGIIFVLLCLRNPFGFYDLPNYDYSLKLTKDVSFMEMLKSTRFIHVSDVTGMESGYTWLTWLISHIGGNINVLLCVHAAFVCVSLFFFIRKNSLSPAFSLFFYLCIGGLTDHTYIIRQSFAFAILLFAFTFVVEKKPLRFLLLVALATWFHRTAMSFILIYPLSYVKLTKKTAIAGIIVSLSMLGIVPLLTKNVIPWAMSVLGKEGYLNNVIDFKEMIIVLTGLLGFVIFITDYSEEIPREDSVSFWLSCLALLFMCVSVYVELIARVGMSMYLPFAMILLPNAMVRNKNRALMNKFGIAIYLALFAYLVFIVVTTPYWYSFVWEPATIEIG